MHMRLILTLATILLPALAGTGAHAQDIFGAIQELAEMENAQEEQTPSGDESENNQQSDGQGGAQAAWEQTLDEYGGVLDELGHKELRCVAMMVLYVYEYVNLVDRTDAETHCKTKYDLYGMQLLSMASSTTIMYCPEGLAAQSNDHLGELSRDYFEILNANRPPEYDYYNLDSDIHGEHGPGLQAQSWDRMNAWARLDFKSRYLQQLRLDAYDEIFYQADDPEEVDREAVEALREDHGFIRHLIGYFDPSYIVPRTLSVGQSMEDLGCSG